MKRNDANILEQTGDVREPGKSEEGIHPEGWIGGAKPSRGDMRAGGCKR